MPQNQATNESGVKAPARLKRNYWSTYLHIPSGKTYRQMAHGINNLWEEVVDNDTVPCDTCNEQVYSVKVRLNKEQLSSIWTQPHEIKRADLGLADNEVAQILQEQTIWRFEPDLNKFSP